MPMFQKCGMALLMMYSVEASDSVKGTILAEC